MTDTEFNLCVKELRAHAQRTSFPELETEHRYGDEADLQGTDLREETDTAH